MSKEIIIYTFTEEHFSAVRQKYEHNAKEFARRAQQNDYRMLPPAAQPQGDVPQINLTYEKGTGEKVLGPKTNKANK